MPPYAKDPKYPCYSSMSTLSQRDVWVGLALTAGAAAVIEVAVRTGVLRIPNPVTLCLIPVIFSGFRFGMRVGLTCAAFAMMYGLYFLSEPGDLFSYVGDNAVKLVAFMIAAPSLAVMTGAVRHRFDQNHERQLRREAEHKVALERAAAELGRSEQMLRMVTDAVPAMLAYVDAGERFVFCNRLYVEMRGRTVEQTIGHTVREVLGEELYASAKPWIDRVLAGEPVSFERVNPGPDGKPMELLVSYVPSISAGGLVFGYSLMMLDITERKQMIKLETELVERDRNAVAITRKNRELETLLHVTSHDLKEPLRAIESFSRMVNERYGDRLDAKGQDFLNRVVKAAQRMGRLLSDVLAHSRAQRMDGPKEPIESEEAVREALRRLDDTVLATGAAVRVAADLPRLMADRLWATQAVYNLVANALKFTRDGAHPDIEIASYRGTEGVGIAVRDRGPGVAPEHADRIFRLFQRAVGREIEGTGAGLAIVQQVAEQHGGRAWVAPREGGGSEFVITFGPAKAPETSALESDS